MKKHLIYSLISLAVLFHTVTFAAENAATDLNTPTMPTDAEIMETISKFNFDKTQQDYLFKETKKRLEDMYSKQDFSSIFEGETTLIDDSAETKKQVSKTKKYSSHSNLTRKSRD